MSRDKFTVVEYNRDMNLCDDQFSYKNILVDNVPCYKVSDLANLINSPDKWELGVIADYIPKVNHCITLETMNHRGKNHKYLYANEALDKFVEEQTVFAMLKGHIKKPIKKHKKSVFIHNKGLSGWYALQNTGIERVECYIVNKDKRWKFGVK